VRPWLLVALVGLGCGGASARPADDVATPPVFAVPPVPNAAPLRRGLPHRFAIDRIELTADGRVAVTRDQGGKLRLWPALDGSREPLPIPAPEARDVDLAPSGDGHDIALIDTAGGVHVFHGSPGGDIERRWQLPAELGALDLELLGGGGLALIRGDRVIELRGPEGERIAEYERRQFRPDRLHVTGKGSLLAIEIAATSSSASLSFHRLAARRSAAGGAAITPLAAGYTVSVPSFLAGHDQSALSPDGKRFAFLRLDQPSARWRIVLVDLAGASHREITLEQMPLSQMPALGFVGAGRLMLRGGVNTPSWIVDVATGAAVPAPARGDIDNNGFTAFAPGLAISALGAWLQIYRVADRESLYLGYEAFSPMAAAYSPSAELAAWGSGYHVYLETLGGRVTRREMDAGHTVRGLSLVDSRRVLAVYQAGVVELHDWKSGRRIDRVDGGGNYVASRYDPTRRLLYTMPLHGQVWLTEITERGLEGPYVITDGATRAGFLDGDKALWTLDSSGALSTYSLEQIRRGVSVNDAGKGDRVGGPLPLAVGRDRTIFAVSHQSGRVLLVAYSAPEGTGLTPAPITQFKAEAVIPAAAQLAEISPDGEDIAVLSSNVLTVHRTADLEERWSFPFPGGVFHLEWTPDSSHLSVATQGGGAVLAASDGRAVLTSCGPRFVARRIQPASLFVPSQHHSICEE
jgi:hypothetical protein